MSETVKRVNVTLPVEHVEQIKQAVSAHRSDHSSVSAFVAAAVAEKLAERDAQELLHQALVDYAGEPTADDRAWAEEALRVAREVASGHDPQGPPPTPHQTGPSKRDVA